MNEIERPRHRRRVVLVTVTVVVAAALSCSRPEPESLPDPFSDRTDPHSYAEPDLVRVERLELDLTVDFERRVLRGSVGLDVRASADADRLVLDTSELEIERVEVDGLDEPGFTVGARDPILGSPLTVPIRPATTEVVVHYRTPSDAAALMWLTPEQTDAGTAPFVFSQNQPILARTWIPCQDTPGVRTTYRATLRVPRGLLAVMSAANPVETSHDGVYHFDMDRPIPSYLIAFAVGELAFRPIGRRAGVYAEPTVVESAAWEFADTPRMMEIAEELYGPYRWDRFDLLVLPPAFPFGGMENPRLTFLTPTVLSGDRSLVTLVAHELAHSWSGNLVTNASWEDVWLNEGFTSYFEHRIMERLAGPEHATLMLALDRQSLEARIAELGSDHPDTRLVPDLAGRDPDDGASAVTYDKGALFLVRLEQVYGREVWDRFLASYFDDRAFGSVDTETFLVRLEQRLAAEYPDRAVQIDVDEWVRRPGLPDDCPNFASSRLANVNRRIEELSEGSDPSSLDVSGWTTHEWVYFVRSLPAPLDVDRMAALDRAFGFTHTGNAEVSCAWLELAIRSRYAPARSAIRTFLTSVGRRKFLVPLYRALAETPDGRREARAIFEEARSGYHSIAVTTVETILEPSPAGDPITGS